MRTSSRRAALVLSCLLPACAEPPPPKEPVAPPPLPVASSEPAPAAAPDLSPVEEPAALIAVARWKGPVRGIDGALKVIGVPISVESLLALAEPELVRLVGFDASVDAAAALDPASTDDDPKVFAAVSIPLAGFDAARERIEQEGQLTEIRPGVLRLAKRGEKEACDLAMAVGDAPARLVCAPGEQDLDALRPWLVRGLPRTPPDTGDLVATLRLAPLKARYLDPLRTKAATLGDEARTGLAHQGIADLDLLSAPAVVLDEGIKFLEDLDRIELRTTFASTPPELAASGAVRFGSRSSWLTHALTEVNDRAGSPPAMFWRAPADAYSATWGHGSDPHLYDGVGRVLRKALAEVLARAPLESADKDAIAAFVDAVPRSPGSWVSAQGMLKTGVKPGKAAAGHTAADARALVTDALGWHIAGIEALAPEYVAWAKRALVLYERAVALVRKNAGGPDAKNHALSLIPRVTRVSAPPGWPRGTVAFDVLASYDDEIAAIFLPHKAGSDDGPAKKKGPGVKGSITFRLAIVPDGDLTWVGFSADLDALRKHMAAVMPGAPAAGTLASREGLAPLKRPGQTWGGFFSVGDLIERAVTEAVKEKPEHAEDAKAILATMPNKGRTPVLLIGSGAAGPKPSSAVEVRIQQGSLADVAALAAFFMTPRGREMLKKIE